MAGLLVNHSDSHIIIDQETNRGGNLLNKNIGEI